MGKQQPALFNISPKNCLRVYAKIRNTANSNWRASKVLAKNGFYGQSFSLATASIEEHIKCLLVLLEGKGFRFRTAKGMNRYYKEHGIRYYTALMLLCIYIFGEELLIKLKQLVKDPKRLIALVAKAETPGFTENVSMPYLRGKFKEMEQELPFFLALDKNRQQGFYSDQAGNDFLSPDTMTADQLENAMKKFRKIRFFLTLMIGAMEDVSGNNAGHIQSMKDMLNRDDAYKKIGAYLSAIKNDQLFEKFSSFLATMP